MKQNIQWLLLFSFVLFMITSCTDEDIELLQTEGVSQSTRGIGTSPSNYHRIGLANAIKLANAKLQPGKQESLPVSVTPVLAQTKEASNYNISDTLAFILNFPKGFAIVSNDDRCLPILGYSQTGSFSMENELAKHYVVENIEPLMINTCAGSVTNLSAPERSGALTHYSVQPPQLPTLGQRHPYDKYVISEHPGCPSGCVPVACATLLTATQKKLEWKGYLFNFPQIKEALIAGPSYDDHIVNTLTGTTSRQTETWTGPINFIDTYDGAIDAMSRLLYELGKDMHTEYKTEGSFTYYSHAYQTLWNAGIDMTFYNSTYDSERIVSWLEDCYYVFQTGIMTSKDGKVTGHAWSVLGCDYWVDPTDNNKVFNLCLYCDWGWNGLGNGFYTDSLFSPYIGHHYYLTDMFGIKIKL